MPRRLWRKFSGTSLSPAQPKNLGHARRKRLSLEQCESRNLLAVLTWSPGVNLPAPRAAASAIETAAQTILVVGGGTTTVNQLSSGANSWSTASALDIARISPGIGATGSQFLVYGGASGSTPLEEALTYDPYNIDNVQDAATMNTPRKQLAFATDGNQPYAIGGLGNGNAVLSSVERYNVAQDSWSNVAPLPQGRFAFAAVDDGAGHIFTFGGATVNNSTSVSSTVYRYTVATNSWQTMAPMLTATRDSAAVMGSDGRIYVLGGSSGNSTLATVQSYDPAANTWRTETNLPAPLSQAAAVTDALGRIEVIGGYDLNHVALSTVIVSQRLNQPDVAPAITSTAPTTVTTGSTYTYQVVATGNPQPTYSLVTAPAGMTIDAGTGLISWAPTVAQAGSNGVTVRATNVAGSVDQSFSVRVYTPAPTVPTGLHVTGTATNSVSLAWNAATDSVGVAGYRVYRVTHTGWHGTVTSYTQYADVPGTSATISVPNSGYSYTFAVSAYNASGNISGHSSSVTATTQSPASFLGPASVSVTATHPLSFTLSASGNPATFTYTPISVPVGMTVNPTTGLVTWTPGDSDVGTGSYSFSISNGVGTTTAVVGVQVLPNLPNVTYVPGGAAVVSRPYSAQFSQVADPYNASPVTYSLVTAPAGTTVDPNTGLVSWTPSVSDIGTASFTVRATNYAGVRDTSFTVPVYFASAAQNVVASNISTTGATLNWSPPAVSVNPVEGYHISVSYVTHSGRFNTTHTLNYTTSAAVTSLVLTGLPSSKSMTVSVRAYDAASHDGLAGTTHFNTAYATPTVTVSGAPFTYDGAPHAATATATGIGGVAVSGSFIYLYDGSDIAPTEPGTYAVEAIFTSANSYYSDAVGTGSLTINPAPATIIIDGGPADYDGVQHAVTATAYALDGVTPIAGSFTFDYEGSPTPPSNPGVYAVTASFTSADPRYANTVTSGALTITSTGTLVPTIVLAAGPFTYDGAPHAATVAAYQTNGVTPLAGTFSALTYDGQATLPTAAGTYMVEGTFASRDPSYADALVFGTLTIDPATPNVLITGDTTYDGYAHDAQAWALALDGYTPLNGSFTFTYNGSSVAPIAAGTYAVVASFASGDSNYADTVATGSMTIAQATPYVVIEGGPYSVDGQPHASQVSVLGIDGATPVPGGFVVTYDGSSALPTSAGVHVVSVVFTSADPNYADTTTEGTLVINPAAQLVPNVYDPYFVDLVWNGTAGADDVQFEQLDDTTIRVTTTRQNGQVVNRVETFTGVTGTVIASGAAGNDIIDASGLTTIAASLDGGAGNNMLYGSQASDWIVGGSNGGEGQQGSNVIIAGDGDDVIFGNDVTGAEGSKGGNNLIVGGAGNDTIYGSFGYVLKKNGDFSQGGEGGQNLIVGGGGSDLIYASQEVDGAEGGHGSILIADDTTLGQAALGTVLAEWTSADTYAQRVGRIDGTQAGGANGANHLQVGVSVLNDESVDELYGDSHGGLNWLLYNLEQDLAYRTKAGEAQTGSD